MTPTGRIDHLYRDPHEEETRLFLHYADLTDSSSLIGHLHRIKPVAVRGSRDVEQWSQGEANR